MHPCLLLVLMALASPAGAIAITEFCPDPWLPQDADEYVVLEGNGSLGGVAVSDGEGGFRFPEGAVIRGQLVVARGGEAFRTTHGIYPDYEWENTVPQVPDVVRSGRFQLANTHDQLQLYVHGTLVQEVVWPGQVAAREGQVHILEGGTWDSRVLMLGQSRLTPASFSGVSGTAFVAPDCSRQVFLETVQRAGKEVLVSVYEFTSPGMAHSLVEAHERGADVRVLLEGGPVGGVSKEEKGIIAILNSHRLPVAMMQNAGLIHSPYRFMHTKYLVVDREEVLITSENFKEHGFPPAGTRGNRGWGVVLSHPELAEYYAGVFLHDAGGAWAVPAVGKDGAVDTAPDISYRVEFAPLAFEGATVTAVVAPDTSHLITALLDGATRGVDIEVAYITNESPGVFNPFLGAAINASRRGVPVRVLLDSYPYNIEGDEDNDEMVAVVNDLARSESLPLQARCADLGPGRVEKVHNKGAIVDGTRVLVGSINWNSNSPAFNREAAVIIDHPAVGSYFTVAFEKDWESAQRSGKDKNMALEDPWKIVALGAVITALLLYSLHRRRGGPGSSGRRGDRRRPAYGSLSSWRSGRNRRG